MSDPNDKLKIAEDLRFFVEQMLMNRNIKGIGQLQSFTVNLQDGSVKSVKAKMK